MLRNAGAETPKAHVCKTKAYNPGLHTFHAESGVQTYKDFSLSIVKLEHTGTFASLKYFRPPYYMEVWFLPQFGKLGSVDILGKALKRPGPAL